MSVPYLPYLLACVRVCESRWWYLTCMHLGEQHYKIKFVTRPLYSFINFSYFDELKTIYSKIIDSDLCGCGIFPSAFYFISLTRYLIYYFMCIHRLLYISHAWNDKGFIPFRLVDFIARFVCLLTQSFPNWMWIYTWMGVCVCVYVYVHFVSYTKS